MIGRGCDQPALRRIFPRNNSFSKISRKMGFGLYDSFVSYFQSFVLDYLSKYFYCSKSKVTALIPVKDNQAIVELRARIPPSVLTG